LYSFRDLLNGPGRRDLVIHDRTCVCVYRLISDSHPRVFCYFKRCRGGLTGANSNKIK
jgi:hypothetical protein